ncbi:MAG: CocE/NonD family hydrolase [Bacillota bacterium]
MPPRYFDIHRETIYIPMRDGVRLAANLYMPATEGECVPGPHPTIIERTPYDRTNATLVRHCTFFARRGYVAVAQDVRGRFESEGKPEPFGPVDVEDGFDTCEWLSTQPWCDGKIGTMGTSYSSMNQAHLAASDPPGLASQFMNQGFSNNFNGRIRQGGALRQSMVAWIFRQAPLSKEALVDPALRDLLQTCFADTQKWLSRGPIRRGVTPLRHVPEYENHAVQITTRGELDRWWTRRGIWMEGRWDELPDVPRYLASGWYDSHSHVITDAFGKLAMRQEAPTRLIMGPWTHGSLTPEIPRAGEAYFGPEATLEWNELRLAWFDETLRDMDAGLSDLPPVRIFVMGGGTGLRVRNEAELAVDVGGYWRYENEWPPADAKPTEFYFHEAKTLALEPSQKPKNATTYRFNPQDPVPTVGGPLSSVQGLQMVPGAFDQRARPELGHRDDLPLASRADVLVFQTPPLREGIEVTGHPRAVLYVSSSAPDTDFTVKLIDVYPSNADFPDGLALNVTDGILRVRYRESWTHPELLESGEIVRLEVELPPTSIFFAAGHRIRVDVSSSNWPRFDVNPNTGEAMGRHRKTEVANNTLYHDRDHPSHLILPLLSREGEPS